jgi:uncharacterized protein
MTIPTIDTHEFTRRGDAAGGTQPLAGLERLGSMLSSTAGALDWRLSGRSELGPDGSRSAFLRLELEGAVRMRCVRCLEPVELPLKVGRDYRLVATEAQAEREDAEEEAFDVLVSARRFDLSGLVEDEAIMALPAAPAHDACDAPGYGAAPGGAAEDAADGGAGIVPGADRPFAALAALRDATAASGRAPRSADVPAPDADPGGRRAPGAGPAETPDEQGPQGAPAGAGGPSRPARRGRR